MQIIEFVVQGVRRFKDSFKIQAKPGLVMLVGGNESGKTTILDALEASLFPSSSQLSSELTNWEIPDVSRAAVVFRAGPEQETFRIVRDFVKGASSLSKLDPATKKFAPITSDAGQIETELLNLGIPPLEVYQTLCNLRQLDSEAAGAKSAFGGAPSDELALLPPEEKERKIAEIKEALEGAGKLDKLQFELDGLEGHKFDLQNKVKRVDEMDANAKKAAAALDKPEFDTLAGISKEQEERIRNYDEKSGERKREISHLENLVLAQHQEADAARRKKIPVFKHPIVLGGSGLIFVSIVLMIFLMSQDNPHASKSVLLIMIGGGIIGFGYLNWVKQMSELDGIIAKPEKTEQQKLQSQRKYELEAADVMSILRRLDADRPGEILERLAVYKKQKAQADKLRDEADAAKKDPEYQEASGGIKEVTEKIRATQAEIKRLGAAASIDPGELRRQLDRLQGSSGKGGGIAGVGAGRLIAAACNYLDEAADVLAAAVSPRTSAHLQTITENRYSLVSLSGDGSAALKHIPTSRERQLGEVSPSVLNAFQFALHTTLIEYISEKKEKMPLFVDSGTGGLDDKWLAGVLRTFKAVGAKSQIVMTTSRSQIASMADLALKLP